MGISAINAIKPSGIISIIGKHSNALVETRQSSNTEVCLVALFLVFFLAFCLWKISK